MKRLLCALFFAFAVLVFLAPCGRAADGSPGDYDNALKAAKAENKPLLIYFYSKSCYYCTLMDKETLVDSQVAGMIKRDFVFLRVDVDKSGDLSRLYRVSGTPTSWFLDSSGKRIFEAPGFIQRPLYKKLLEYVKGKHYNEMDVQTYMKKTSAQK
jgi:thioredoxin-related protein